MKKAEYNLLIVAHPDDETIFFGGLLLRRTTRPWKVVCITDGNADGQGKKRKRDFERACRALGVSKWEWWEQPDLFDRRLEVDALVDRMKTLERPYEIFTHGPLGEYEHPHHQDVSYSVHTAFADHPRLYSVAYNAFPEIKIALNQKEFETKTHVLTKVYSSETFRFLNMLPATSSEGFVRVGLAEVRALYEFIALGKSLQTRKLKTYKWLAGYLEQRPVRERPF